MVLFGYVFEWLFIAIGLFAGNAQAAQGMGMLVFPFAFISSAYVPVELDARLAAGVRRAPAAHVMVDAVRALTLGPNAQALLGHSAGYFIVRALAWARRHPGRLGAARGGQVPARLNPHTTKGHTMTQNDMDTERYAELSMQWYGWGSPIGLGIGLVLIGGFVALLATAWSLVN